jgi:hypothetical protein
MDFLVQGALLALRIASEFKAQTAALGAQPSRRKTIWYDNTFFNKSD